MKKIFLGGTCNNSTWREELIPLLKIDYYNPVVKTWTDECKLEEISQRESCDYVLYVITPKMHGYYSIAEVTDDSNKRPSKTILCVISSDNGYSFTMKQMMGFDAIKLLIKSNGANVFDTLEEIAQYVNNN
jgi:hypothetical protein